MVGLQTWKAVSQVRGEWKRTAIPIVKKGYFEKHRLLSATLTERQEFARWLLNGDDDARTDVFVFDKIHKVY